MDEEEDEDNAPIWEIISCSGQTRWWWWRSKIWSRKRADGNKRKSNRRYRPKRNAKIFENFFILLALNVAFLRNAFADSLHFISHSPSRSKFVLMSRTDEYSDSNGGDTVLDRRIRHDTVRSATNKRFISFEPPPNSVPDIVERVENTSHDSSHDPYFDRFEAEKARRKNTTDEAIYDSKTTTTTPSVSSSKSNESCTCFADRKKISRAFHSMTISIRHPRLNVSEGIIVGVMYDVIIQSNMRFSEAFVASEDANGLPTGVFQPSHKLCSNAVRFYWEESNDSQTLLNWSLPAQNRNLTLARVIFRLCFKLTEHNHTVYETTFNFPVLKGCEFYIWPQRGSLSSTELFEKQGDFSNCSIIFSSVQNGSENFRQRGLIIKLTRLNVRCDKGNISFSFNSSVLLCGKLEEIAAWNREFYFPPAERQPRLIVVGRPVFAISYQLVDYCYNVTLTAPNDSVIMNPLLKIFCNYHITLPYGYRADVSVSIKSNVLMKNNFKNSSTSAALVNDTDRDGSERDFAVILAAAPDPTCDGIMLRYWDGNKSKAFCEPGAEVERQRNYHFRFKTDENRIRFRISSRLEKKMTFYLKYEAITIADVVDGCPFGSISLNSFCVSVTEDKKLEWTKAEEECNQNGGHLASILDEQSQAIVDQFLMKSPGYQDYNSYWIGASDIGHEGEYQWTNSLPLSYTNWFGGWPLYGYYNRQPNDDGFSSQDCVELRRQYHISPAGINVNGSKVRLTSSFMWNDRDCRTENYFLCEFLKSPSNSPARLPKLETEQCDQKITLNENNDRAVISSPGFPHNYPNNKNCLVNLSAPASYKIVIVFEEFVLEEEPNCSYDYLKVYEDFVNNTDNDTNGLHRFCGDWSDKLKLLRYVSPGPRLHLRFISDYSHSFSGYKAHVNIEQVKTECSDNRLQTFNGSCYLFVSYPQVTWQTAQDICKGIQGNLASVHSLEEEYFIVAKIRESHEYTSSTIYWLGGKFTVFDEWKWVDNTSIIFNAWVPMKLNPKLPKTNKNDFCLGMQWIPSPSSVLPSGLYWVPVSCQKTGGYVCKLQNRVTEMKMNLNSTVNGTEGEFTSPNFPGNYYHNLDYWVRIIGPENTRIIIQFHSFDLEDQKNCVYDYLEIFNITEDTSKQESVKSCGHYNTNSLHRLNFVSSKNEAILRFHSDYSTAGSGFLASWKAVDISGCPMQTLTAKEGEVASPNYPNFLLANLQCRTTILAPVGRQVWFEIADWDFDKKGDLEKTALSDTDLYFFLSNKEKLYPLHDASVLSDGVYLSYGEYMRIHLKTGDAPNGRGFRGTYKTLSELKEIRVVNLGNNSFGNIYHLNFPLKPVAGLHFIQRFVAPLGYSIQLHFYQVVPSTLGVKGRTVCQEDENKGFIEVRDHYADRSGTWWQFCETNHSEISHLAITSYLNTITVKQISDNSTKGVLLNASISVIPDPNYKHKILQFPEDHVVESCIPNPCYNNGKCISDELTKHCQCANHFTGLFCALTICDLNPCVFGVCELTVDYFRCICQQGYEGKLCDKKIKPCSTNPCEGRGECIEKNNFTYICRCHAWWEGERCDKKITNIPYKPLTDRMLQEPFWLGLLTVIVVLTVIGLVWCARRHFPEKLEKLLAEEAERNRHYTSTGRAGVSRGDIIGQNGIATAVNASQPNTANSSPNPRTLLGRLGIRKPSLFSLTSPLQPTHTARTFSLDDLFKSSSSRSQMSYKHRNSSSHRKKSIDKSLLKKQDSHEGKMESKKKMDAMELEESSTTALEKAEIVTAETSFIISKEDKKPDKKPELNNKYEKKVHFARLMSRVQAEISSTSDVELGSFKEKDDTDVQIMPEKPLAASTQTLVYQPKSPHSTSSNQGSDSLSSSEMTLISASGEKLNNRRPSLLTLGTNGKCQKAASADSILAMFRKFSLSTAPSSECNSNFVSASTSPTISSPQDEAVGSDDSSLSSFHVGGGFPSCSLAESPPCVTKMQQSTIQVSVLDPLNSQKETASVSSSNLLHPPTILLEVPNKCLSPIREVPTPSPSPSMTPIMSRYYISTHLNNNTSSSQDSLDIKNTHRTDFISQTVIPATRFSAYSSADTTSNRNQFVPAATPEISVSAPSPDSSLTEDATSVTVNSLRVIPTFTIQEPSPAEEAPSIVLCPSTPPTERRASFPMPKAEEKNACSDLYNPPIITVTCTGEADSEPDCLNNKCSVGAGNSMSYLSPFSMCSRADRTTSESNLSSSGYSSMASPSPSRCGSNNPLCLLEGDDQCSILHTSPRKPSPLLRTPSGPDKSESTAPGLPSDSETLSDEHQMESNDEGFSTDQLDEKIKEGEVKSAKELEIFIGNEQEKMSQLKYDQNEVDSELTFLLTTPTKSKFEYNSCSEQNLDNFKKFSSFSVGRKQSGSAELLSHKNEKHNKSSLQLPSIVVDVDSCLNETRSPVSSRSESPLSDRTAGLGRFSPMFYGRLTDSDGIYDWTSSDCLRNTHRKHFGRRREKHRSRSPNLKTKSNSPLLLDVPGKMTSERCRKPSPKRRVRSHQIIKATSSSTSSSESARSHSKICSRRLLSPRRPRYSSKSSSCSTAEEVSGDDTRKDSGPRLELMIKLKQNDGSKEVEISHDTQMPARQSLSFIGKLNSVLSNDKRAKWKLHCTDSASVPLLIHSQPVEENRITPDEVNILEIYSRRHLSKRNDWYFKSSRLTD